MLGIPRKFSSETHECAPFPRILYRGGESELLDLKFTSKDQTLILAQVLKGKSEVLRFSKDSPRLLLGFFKDTKVLGGPRRSSEVLGGPASRS